MRRELMCGLSAAVLALGLVACAGGPPGVYHPGQQTSEPAPAPPPAPKPAPAASTAPAEAAAASKDDPNRIICRTETPTGSRLGGTRTCLTARRWAEIDQAEHKKTDSLQGGGSTAAPPGSKG